jgi:hypothetical protein
MDFMSDLWQFLKDWLLQWINLVGIATIIIWVVTDVWLKTKLPVKMAVAIIIVCLIFAAFGAWRDQYEKAKVVRLRSFVVPPAVCGEFHGNASILFVVEILNSGPPTVVTGFKLKVKAGKREWTLNPSVLPDDAEFFFDEAIGSVKIKPSEMIYNKSVNPIPEGGRLNGFLFYVVEGAAQKDFLSQKPAFTLYFYDAAGKEYKTEIGELPGPIIPIYVPGVDNPFLPFIKRATQPSPTPGK